MQAMSKDVFEHKDAQWPAEVLSILERAITCEYATLTQRRQPITYPVTPYVGDNGRSLDVSTGLTYPAKAERARRNPQVALLYSDAVGSGLHNPPVVLVQGRAAVRDADLQGNTDRYLRLFMAKLPETFQGVPRFILGRMGWYYSRIWIEVTPLRMLWWSAGQLDQPPRVWNAPPGTSIPTSDPPPAGSVPRAWKEQPSDWRDGARYAVHHLGDPILTVVTADGYPLPFRVRVAALDAEGIRVAVPDGIPAVVAGPACLTFHTHPERFTGQRNMVFVGQMHADATGYRFAIDRQLADWSLVGSKLGATWSFLQHGRKLAPRLAAEAQRRGQTVPRIRLPDES